MKVEIEDLSPIKKKMKIEVPHESYQEALERAYRKLNKTVQIKGFRKGKVPRPILEKYYGSRTAMETVSDLVDKSYRDAIQANAIMAVGLPQISDLKVEENAPITFSAEVEVQPKVVAKDYEGIALKKNPVSVSEEDLDNELKALQKSQAQWTPVAESVTAEEGHLVTVNYVGTLEGKEFPGGSAQNVEIPLGLKRFLPDFEKGIVGTAKGASSEFDVAFPEDYGVESLRGKTAHFVVELLEIKQENLPTLDDEFAKDLGAYETLEQIKAEIREKLTKFREEQERVSLFKQVIDHLLAKNEFEIPHAMIHRELDFMWNSVLQQMKQQGVTPDQVGVTAEEYHRQNHGEAERRIKAFLLFDAVAVANQLEVKSEEMEARLAQVAAEHHQPLEAVRRFYEQQNLLRPLFNQILEEKTLDFILSKANIS